MLLEQLRCNRRWRGGLNWLLNLRVGHGSLFKIVACSAAFRDSSRIPQCRSNDTRSHFAASAAAE